MSMVFFFNDDAFLSKNIRTHCPEYLNIFCANTALKPFSFGRDST